MQYGIQKNLSNSEFEKSVDGSDTVTDNGEYIFRKPKGLSGISIPNKITSISEGACYISPKLQPIKLPKDI